MSAKASAARAEGPASGAAAGQASFRRFRRAEDLEGEQRAAALAEGDTVVAAGAGSGKTTVLAARFVRLLEEGLMPSGERVHARNILVLTFTRKAAAEMYARIYGSLAEAAALAADELAAGRERSPGLAAHLDSCLAGFSEAQISTFDSFAARIARSGSARYALAPDFAIDEERARRLASDLALSFLLEHRRSDAMRDLVSSAGFEGARDEVLGELALSHMSLSSPPDFARLHEEQGRALESLEAAKRTEILAMRDAALDYAAAGTTQGSRAWLAGLAADPGEGPERFLSYLGGLDGLRKPGSNSKDEASLFLSDFVPGFRKAAEAYRDIAATLRAQGSRRGLYLLLDEFRARWDEARRREKVLTFRDVARLALDILESDAGTLAHYRSVFRYVMIDEFQDDDELQKRVLFLLAGDEPARLFFVGDEKQSIYLFRGADVSVFRRLGGELAARARAPEAAHGSGPAAGPAAGPAVLSLSKNYRSERGLIAMVNSVFERIMPSAREGLEGEEAADFEARFEALSSREPTPGVEPMLAYLELPRPEEAAGLREGGEAEAYAIARLVREAVEGNRLLVADRESGEARGARYEDFAILLRSTGNQVHFEKFFRLLDIPYAAENSCGLMSEAVACDLYYALELALFPEDRNALAAFLRSPFAGLSDEAVVRLLCSPSDPLAPGAGALLPEEDRPGWERGVETLQALSAIADRAPIASSLCYLWFEAGYRSALLRDPVASAFEEHFELIHSLAVSADARGEGLAAFVASLERLVGKPDKLEIALPRDETRGVRIMTIHKSKGLEFPVVILPQANNVGREGPGGASWYWDERLGPCFRPPAAIGSRSRNAFYEAARERRIAMERAELKRLLYVALTRAESHVIVSATRPRGEDKTARSFRTLLALPLGLFDDPSPLAPEGGTGAAGEIETPLGRLTALSSGAFVGTLAPLGEEEYLGLLGRARRRWPKGPDPSVGPAAPGPADPARPPLIERRATRPSESVSALAERAAEELAGTGAAEQLPIERELAAPEGLESELWGSLVHAALESRLGSSGRRPEIPAPLLERLESALGGEAAARSAAERAVRLAEVFLDSELGRRALAAEDRQVELKVAIGYRSGARIAKGSIDLAFVEAGKVVVVDYKTDASIMAGSHDFQVSAYARAASEIFGLPAEAWVFYLNGGGRAIRVGNHTRLEDAPERESSSPRKFGLKSR
jgi:ATP-dependent helicase/nuclease subunit A